MHEGIHIVRIEDNKNNLPFFIIKMDRCNQTKHMHEFVQIVYMCKGKLKHVINNNAFDVYKGDIFIIPPYVPHYFIDSFEEKYEIIEFELFLNLLMNVFRTSKQKQRYGFMDFAYLEPFLVAENEVKPRLNLSEALKLK